MPQAGYALLVLLAGCSYGVVSPLMKHAYAAGLSTPQVTMAQYGLAAILLWIIAVARGVRLRIPARQWAVLAALGVTGAVTSYFYYWSLSALPASLGIVLLFQFAWIVLVIDIAVRRTLPPLAKWVGVVLIVAGTVLAVGGPRALLPATAGAATSLPVWAVLAGLLAAVGYAGTLYLSGYADPALPAPTRAALVTTIAAVLVGVAFPPLQMPWHSAGLWLWGGLVALASQVVPTMVLMLGVPHVGGRMAGVLGSIELPVAVFVAWAWLGEVVGPLRWLGVILILLGIVISEWDIFIPRGAGARHWRENSG
ncbi:MAG: DMT family transporter [Thermoflavifilum sp.]|nr:DMT family transporter [Thermoflavifilum sp.]MCL6514808.1 DMT family transporter [Alicyclobacillus sp.]